ncbi:MAG TPA: ornithine carbamoyltransferase [Anaerovoracaceae bacterium]|nr:ornithine carbamoyltransferase [Anaerovoracaceae bacterium]
MALNLKGRSLLTLKDFTPEEIRYLLDLAHNLKAKKRAGIEGNMLRGKHIVLLFEKTSTRTRCAFEVACADEGGHVTFLDSNSSQMNIKESMEDSAKVLGRFFDGIEYRGYNQEIVENLAMHSGIPVWNGLTNVDHPTQILADLMTLEEHAKKPLNEIKLVFCGDIRNNMSYAWMYGCAKMGMHFVAFGPKELEIDENVIAAAKNIAKDTGAKIQISHSCDCLKDADALYTDVWASMGEEDLIPERARILSPYKVTVDMLNATENPDILFMHCLPSFHDFNTRTAKEWMEKGIDIREVTDEVFRSRHSIVFAETENRMHTAKAILIATI